MFDETPEAYQKLEYGELSRKSKNGKAWTRQWTTLLGRHLILEKNFHGRLEDRTLLMAKTGGTGRRDQVMGKRPCRRGACTGFGCLVAVNENFIERWTPSGQAKCGGIVTDCLNCIEAGTACPNRTAAFAGPSSPLPRQVTLKVEENTPAPEMEGKPQLTVIHWIDAQDVDNLERRLKACLNTIEYQPFVETAAGQTATGAVVSAIDDLKDIERLALLEQRRMRYHDLVPIHSRLLQAASGLAETPDGLAPLQCVLEAAGKVRQALQSVFGQEQERARPHPLARPSDSGPSTRKRSPSEDGFFFVDVAGSPSYGLASRDQPGEPSKRQRRYAATPEPDEAEQSRTTTKDMKPDVKPNIDPDVASSSRPPQTMSTMSMVDVKEELL